MATSTEDTKISAEILLERAKGLFPLISERAAAAEAACQLTDDVVDAMHDAGLYGMWTPAVLGGAELDPVPGAEIIEQLAYGDPSTSWAFMASTIAIGVSGAYFGDEAVEAMYGGDRMPVLAGHGTRPGIAIPQDGGYVCTGSYSFGSGIKHAGRTYNLALVEGTDEARIYSTRIEDAKLEWDSWDTLGLRATGSIDYSIDGVFVPKAYTHIVDTEEPLRGGQIYTLGVSGFICCAHAAWAVGLGRRMLDELKVLVAAKAGRAGAQADSTAFLAQYEAAEAKLRSARALLYETWHAIGETLHQGDPLTQEQHSLYRLALTNATWSVHEVAVFVYTAGGTTAARPGVIQRNFRDMETGLQHITSSPPVRHNVARALAGLSAGKHWVFLDLVDNT